MHMVLGYGEPVSDSHSVGYKQLLELLKCEVYEHLNIGKPVPDSDSVGYKQLLKLQV